MLTWMLLLASNCTRNGYSEQPAGDKVEDSEPRTPSPSVESNPSRDPVTEPETKPVVAPEVTPPAKPEVTPPAKPEVTPDAKPEVKPEAKPVPKPEMNKPQADLSFGPFGSDENKVLTSFEIDKGKYVDFRIEVDTEIHPDCSYDYVLIQDANLTSRRICNKGSFALKSLKTPVKVTFRSDARISSQSVKLRAIKFHDE